MSPLVDFVVFCCHSVHIYIGESKPLHDDSLLRKIFSLLCSTIFHWKIVQINCCKRNVYHEGERLVYVFGLPFLLQSHITISSNSNQARSCPYAQNQLLEHHFGKKKCYACTKKYYYWHGKNPTFFSIINNHYNVFFLKKDDIDLYSGDCFYDDGFLFRYL